MARALTLLSQVHRGRWLLNPVTGRMQHFRMSMVTLTVSDTKTIDHKQAYKKLLEPFLRWLRYSKKCRHYVWKAELQERGQIHYHLIIPVFIHHRELRDKWNKLQRDAGLLRSFTARTKSMDPNSTDVHSVGKDVGSASKYMIKYMAKADGPHIARERIAEKKARAGIITDEELEAIRKETNDLLSKINGKVWDCSAALSEKYFTQVMTWRLGMILQDYCKNHPNAVFYGERFMFLKMDFSDPPDFMRAVLVRFRCYLDMIRAGGSKVVNAMLN